MQYKETGETKPLVNINAETKEQPKEIIRHHEMIQQ